MPPRPEPGLLDRWVARPGAIWWIASAYFGCYVPFTILTKTASEGAFGGVRVPGVALLPLSTLAGVVVMLGFLAATGWWRSAGTVAVGRRRLPVPSRWTALSGVCTAVILTTTTLAYTFEGVSIVLVMLIMRGGVLVLAPLVDAATGRRPQPASWVGLALSLAALVVAVGGPGAWALSGAAMLDVTLYLLAYFVRLRFMSRLAKSGDPEVTKRYFAEEQLVAAPAVLVVLAIAAIVDAGPFMSQVRAGFELGAWPPALIAATIAIGVCSQLVGIFGTLVFLDRREHTFSVPVNRSASVLAGVTASLVLAGVAGFPTPPATELLGAGLVIGAIAALALHRE